MGGGTYEEDVGEVEVGDLFPNHAGLIARVVAVPLQQIAQRVDF